MTQDLFILLDGFIDGRGDPRSKEVTRKLNMLCKKAPVIRHLSPTAIHAKSGERVSLRITWAIWSSKAKPTHLLIWKDGKIEFSSHNSNAFHANLIALMLK